MTKMKIRSVFLVFSLAVSSGRAFVPTTPRAFTTAATTTTTPSAVVLGAESDGSVLDILQTSFRIAKESNAAGYGVKQVIADVLAGDDFDKESVSKTIEETIASAPCVMYTWESSPSCKKAVEAFATIGASPKIVRLDDPWEEGNSVRATLGRKVGRTSVPFVFVSGKYIGGYDGGLEGNPDASGMVDLAFRGKLRQMLAEAGAM